MSRFWTRALILFILAALSVTTAQEIVVKPGDTLWGLAQRHNTTVEAILATNNLTGTDLFPGAILKLPSGAVVQPSTYTVQAGDTLYDIAARFSISVDELIALNQLEGSLIRVGQQLVVKRGEGEIPAAPLVVTVRPGDTLWALARQHDVSVDALVTANSLTRASVLRPGDQLTIPGRYVGSAGQAAQGGPVPQTITVARGDSLWTIARRHNTTVAALMSANNLSTTSIQVGQQLRIVPTAELSPARPEAAPTPQPQANQQMVWPLRGPITSRFGYRQLRINGSNFHSGLDIDGNVGDPIVSATAGVVTFSGWRGGYGNLVIVSSGNTDYYYAHASQLLVSVGQQVQPGQLIAKVGATGAATGPHLHFEVRVDGNPIDPLPLLERYAGR
jgi:murein DD-endopeptidase MepM/ murein hydrolase activator NlpD